MKRLILGAGLAVAFAFAVAGDAKALPAAPGVIGDQVSGSQTEPVARVCWWRGGVRHCTWRNYRHHRVLRHRHGRRHRW